MAHHIVIGGGQAAASLVAKLRDSGFDGDITLIGAEPVPPYQRPPLSKAYLLGDMTLDRLFLRPEQWYSDNNITLRTGVRVTQLDAHYKTLHLDTGEVLTYDKLALTTGAHPRTLPAEIGGMLQGVHTVRDLRDADAMAPAFRDGARLLVIGGGYIGLEAAAVAAKKGVKVTLVEMADRILQRVACPETSAFFRDLHRAHGVDIREGVGLQNLTGTDRVTGAILTDGTELEVDFAIVGVGIQPATALAEGAGLEIDNGIVTDPQCRTSDPDIHAAGDCATCHFKGQRIRLESVGNAIDMAEIAARNMAGEDVAYAPKPWFWSDQYDCKLQIAGLNMGYDAVHVRDGGEARSHWYYKGDDLIAVDAMNDARTYMVAKRLIEAGKSPAPEVVTDLATDMKALLKA
ncbi:NAD(P)/FAD-dependent oxidoreductase [Roseovarius sp. SYSU LYC5161]|jgi:3-phenylpropionate/trans-cinnamate dioxygenase ferredoxin reductase subunit|uniref:NAD(P)/FAD-dependent oxidoreductase n=1 Tax=Roseovarius halophilus (ex Wu et al. 2025) TaxID=3376060 RepID=UPI00399B745E